MTSLRWGHMVLYEARPKAKEKISAVIHGIDCQETPELIRFLALGELSGVRLRGRLTPPWGVPWTDFQVWDSIQTQIVKTVLLKDERTWQTQSWRAVQLLSLKEEEQVVFSFELGPHAPKEKGRNLAIGIGIQNFPEGLAVSLPLRGAGFSTWRAFWYGQLSGMVEPLAGVFGAFAVVLAEPLLPYALAFAAGAMVYVVMDDIIPEAQISGNGKLASWASILGFVVMMSLDVGLG
ncbi:hypothetical protein CB1_000245024 [Camelus ferus]|nr:hypothetical protein CB1_000245024 [Camelus ferus]